MKDILRDVNNNRQQLDSPEAAQEKLLEVHFSLRFFRHCYYRCRRLFLQVHWALAVPAYVLRYLHREPDIRMGLLYGYLDLKACWLAVGQMRVSVEC